MVLEAELDQLRDLAMRVCQEVDLPSLCEVLNRASIVTSARGPVRPARVDASRRGRTPGPLPARGQADGLFTSEPEKRIGPLTSIQDEAILSVDARVPGPGCAKTRKPGANPTTSRAKREQRRSRHPWFPITS